MFAKVLVANRGEIALRVMRCLREMGIRSVAVASEADRMAPHALAADELCILGAASAQASYLNQDAVLRAARESGAQAIHPGYGFLSENADFAAACARAGVTFIGPPAEAIRLMGSKIESREAARAAGLPIVPGFDRAGASGGALLEEARRLGWPILIKASAGGGGKGMRLVRSEGEFASAFPVARGEAEAAFGDGSLYLERWLERPRHIEIQVFGDAQGRVFHLGERECSVQRRHQKIFEECPSAAVSPELRATMGQAAVRLAASVGYRNAGTVEFLLSAEGEFYFLEMNARLQVEHPVTEMVYGVDLVAAQILTAAGRPLAFDPESLTPRGHAIEARVYAEDPAQGFLPQIGRVLRLAHPERPGVRVDSGLRKGTDVLVHYDPLLAKVVAWAEDRASATRRLREALAEFVLLGVGNNLDFLQEVLALPAWQSGDLHNDFIEQHLAGWRGTGAPPAEAAALAALALSSSRVPAGTAGGGDGEALSPWSTLGDWTPLEEA
jgi:3-methylcrotonyl-CoA carboxylase alpha subunit